MVECRTTEREVWGSKPTSAVLCPWARHFTPRKYWLITQEAVAPSRHDWQIVDWDVKPQHKQTNKSKINTMMKQGWRIDRSHVLWPTPGDPGVSNNTTGTLEQKKTNSWTPVGQATDKKASAPTRPTKINSFMSWPSFLNHLKWGITELTFPDNR